MAILLQSLALGSALAPAGISHRPAATLFRVGCPIRFGRWRRLRLATDLAEVIDKAIGLNLIFGIPLEIGVMITALDVFLIL